ncbi:hypothetical protein AB0B88_16220 [Micromonospora haikouensis]|uniref:hypothetical protein n=1 Tax=Actinomycetes TaxID=1760 RepID=UPI0033FFF364
MVAVEPLDLAALARIRYADVEQLITEWIRGAFAALNPHVVTELPDATEMDALMTAGRLVVQVEAFGGADRNPAQDVANVDVDVYAPGDADGNPDRGRAADTAELLRVALLFVLPGFHNEVATVSEVATMSRPTARPYDDNTKTRRFSAAYQVVVKSH